MIPSAIFNFQVHANGRSITIERSFTAPLRTVWAAWTRAEILCQWWAPRPYECVIVSLDLREGGRWRYQMQGPDGDRHHCFFDYEEVKPESFFSGTTGFCGADGTPIASIPRSRWEVRFTERSGRTIVNVGIHYESQDHLGVILKMGFKEGFTMGLDQLEELLKAR
ncbi:MAG: SRPBCC domain-containing protein [Flavobacteriales bacterium]